MIVLQILQTDSSLFLLKLVKYLINILGCKFDVSEIYADFEVVMLTY